MNAYTDYSGRGVNLPSAAVMTYRPILRASARGALPLYENDTSDRLIKIVLMK